MDVWESEEEAAIQFKPVEVASGWEEEAEEEEGVRGIDSDWTATASIVV